jgi:hypothetical protein
VLAGGIVAIRQADCPCCVIDVHVDLPFAVARGATCFRATPQLKSAFENSALRWSKNPAGKSPDIFKVATLAAQLYLIPLKPLAR